MFGGGEDGRGAAMKTFFHDAPFDRVFPLGWCQSRSGKAGAVIDHPAGELKICMILPSEKWS